MSPPTTTAPPRSIWNGIFGTWREACDAASDSGAFASDRWKDRIVSQLQGYRRDLETFGSALPPRPSNLATVAAVTRPKRVVDFGGSSGWAHDYLRHCVPDLRLESYTVIELERTVEFMRASGLHLPPVRYAGAQDAPQCDLLYCNSVLQYFGSNQELLELMRATAPRHVLLDDLLARDAGDFFTTQAYYDTAIPHRFIGLRELGEDLRTAGYAEIARVPFASPVLGELKPLPMDNLPREYRIRYATSLLFARRPDR